MGDEQMNNFNLKAAFIEPVNSREASKFIANNYDEIAQQVRKMGVHPDMVHDVIADVYISINNAEENGEGYDFNYVNEGITVEEFIYGRLKGYSKNAKYRTDVVQANTSGYTLEKLKEDRKEICNNYQDASIKQLKLMEIDSMIKDLEKTSFIVFAGSAESDDVESMDSFQKAYATAGAYDDLEDIESMIDIREQINYCLEFEGRVGMSVIGLLKNLDKLNSDLVNKSLFDRVKDAVKYHDEFGDALRNIIEFSIKQKSLYDTVIATY